MIFQNENKESIVFYFRPCETRRKVQPLVEKHGGKVTSRLTPNAVKLAEDDDHIVSEDYISARYIEDCITKGTLLEKEAYKLKPRRCVIRENSEDKVSDISFDEDDVVTVKASSKYLQGRKAYTYEEDMAMLKYIIDNSSEDRVGGNALWKEMETLKVTNHSAASMCTRYRKNIKSNLNLYDISFSWKKRLNPDYKASNWGTSTEISDRVMRKGDLKSPKKNTEVSSVEAPKDKIESKMRQSPLITKTDKKRRYPSCGTEAIQLDSSPLKQSDQIPNKNSVSDGFEVLQSSKNPKKKVDPLEKDATSLKDSPYKRGRFMDHLEKSPKKKNDPHKADTSSEDSPQKMNHNMDQQERSPKKNNDPDTTPFKDSPHKTRHIMDQQGRSPKTRVDQLKINELQSKSSPRTRSHDTVQLQKSPQKRVDQLKTDALQSDPSPHTRSQYKKQSEKSPNARVDQLKTDALQSEPSPHTRSQYKKQSERSPNARVDQLKTDAIISDSSPHTRSQYKKQSERSPNTRVDQLKTDAIQSDSSPRTRRYFTENSGMSPKQRVNQVIADSVQSDLSPCTRSCFIEQSKSSPKQRVDHLKSGTKQLEKSNTKRHSIKLSTEQRSNGPQLRGHPSKKVTDLENVSTISPGKQPVLLLQDCLKNPGLRDDGGRFKSSDTRENHEKGKTFPQTKENQIRSAHSKSANIKTKKSLFNSESHVLSSPDHNSPTNKSTDYVLSNPVSADDLYKNVPEKKSKQIRSHIHDEGNTSQSDSDDEKRVMKTARSTARKMYSGRKKRRVIRYVTNFDEKDTDTSDDNIESECEEENNRKQEYLNVEHSTKWILSTAEKYQISPTEVVHVINCNNGNLKDTLKWLDTAGDKNGQKTWDPMDDCLLSKNTTDLLKKYGKQLVLDRIVFLDTLPN